MKTRFSILVACLGSFVVASFAANWPQWRGPERSGISQETGLLKEWPKEGPKLLWQVNNLGRGYSTPAVVGERLYLLSNQGMEDEFVKALSAKDGKEVWSKRLGRVGNPDQKPSYPAARSTPTVDGDLLYALGSDGDLLCLERTTGKVRWQKNLRTDFGGQPGIWAYAESPLIDGDVLVCTPGGADATLVALRQEDRQIACGNRPCQAVNRRLTPRWLLRRWAESNNTSSFSKRAWSELTPETASFSGATTRPLRAAQPTSRHLLAARATSIVPLVEAAQVSSDSA